MVYYIENKCNEPIYFDPDKLKLQEKKVPENESIISPTKRGMQYQINRLSSGWIKPDENIQGYLIYCVRHRYMRRSQIYCPVYDESESCFISYPSPCIGITSN